MPKAGGELFALKGSTSELLARLLEESDKAFGGTRLLTTQQLEGQQARRRRAQEFAGCNKTPSPQPHCGWREQREQGAADTSARHCSPRGVCRVCVYTHSLLSPFTERNTTAFNSELNSQQAGSPEFSTCSCFAMLLFKQLQNVVPPPVSGRRKMQFCEEK